MVPWLQGRETLQLCRFQVKEGSWGGEEEETRSVHQRGQRAAYRNQKSGSINLKPSRSPGWFRPYNPCTTIQDLPC